MNEFTPRIEKNISDRNQLIQSEIDQINKCENFIKKLDNFNFMQWVVSREGKEVPGHIEKALKQITSERFNIIFGINPKKIICSVVVNPFKWPLNENKPGALEFFQSCMQGLIKEEELMQHVEKDIQDFEEFVTNSKEYVKLNPSLATLKNLLTTSPATIFDTVDGPAIALKFLVLVKESVKGKLVSKFYIACSSADDEKLLVYSKRKDCVGAFANYVLSSNKHSSSFTSTLAIKMEINKKFGKPQNHYIDLLLPSLSGEVILYEEMFKKNFLMLKSATGDCESITEKSHFYKLDKRVLTIFKKNQKAQNDLYQLIYEASEQLISKIPERRERLSTLLKFTAAYSKTLYVNEKLENAKINDTHEKLHQAEKNQKKLLVSEKKNTAKSKKSDSKSKPDILEKFEKIVEVTAKSATITKLLVDKSLEKPYEFFHEPPITSYSTRVSRWFKQNPDKGIPFKEYSDYPLDYQRKVQCLHDFSLLVDHFAFDPNFVYLEGDCRHLFVAYEFENGTIDTGVTTYHFTNPEHTACDHRFHSRLSPFELATKGFSENMDKIFKESLENIDCTETQDVYFHKHQSVDKCWINEEYGYITIVDKKYNMKIHIYKRISDKK